MPPTAPNPRGVTFDLGNPGIQKKCPPPPKNPVGNPAAPHFFCEKKICACRELFFPWTCTPLLKCGGDTSTLIWSAPLENPKYTPENKNMANKGQKTEITTLKCHEKATKGKKKCFG